MNAAVDITQDICFQIADLKFYAKELQDKSATERLKKILFDRKALPLLQALAKDLPSIALTLAETDALKTSKSEELSAIEEKLRDAEQNLGESEVQEALVSRADFFARIGSFQDAMDAYEKAESHAVGVGSKLDILFCILRLGLADCISKKLLAKTLERAKDLVENGGDWERRNRLKVYEATYLFQKRDFKGASKLLLDSLATFSAYELHSYSQFIFYTILSSLIAVDRPTLKTQVITSPEVLSCAFQLKNIFGLLNGLVACDYHQFMNALLGLFGELEHDRYLKPHTFYIIRELRIVAYHQFLISYQSVTLEAMAKAFGLSTTFLDKELARFIVSGRINCKIDRIQGIIETNRPDTRNSLYQQTIKQGDVVLNKIQKLSRFIDI
ncbi:26S proteasome regulatory subunit N7 [Galdieria sulphuraria]|uniref:26S proteasome regulatory subunit N7 n=1 Tax=Galdieria sulphuraria TaxID=130081 RepID=M2W5I0_GALSU|nr:26S proteasome regulatory subunit N7 [Galdieria sulphuraria]EME31041.1 26S proteasome regulatory subunit N7 [Galdieria sulphuraria]|eukprot:XP_005707561.1 26S proteasome regulatory subunit N7 [Galdieria sulphuraria]